MHTPNEDRKRTGTRDALKQQPEVCGPEGGCHAEGGSGRVRWVIGAVVLAGAWVVAARSVVKAKAVSADKAVSGFASAQATGQTYASAGDISSAKNDAPATMDTIAGREIGALSELNTVAADTNAVFIFLPDKKEKAGNAPAAQIRSAVRTLETRGGKLGVFTLKPGARDYEQITAQVAVPAVLAMVKGRGMSAVSGEITETKLVQAFVGASNARGCGPAAGSGCCPK